MSLPKPYYDKDGITIYHGDCRDILPSINADAVVTDPPYGINFKYDSYKDDRESWFMLMNATVPLMRAAARFIIMPCCGIDRLDFWYKYHKPDWMVVWYKGSPGHRSFIGFNDWEAHIVWGKPPKAMHDYFACQSGIGSNSHPCPKPIQWANWLVLRACSDAGTIVDPFMGSGTVLCASKNNGRRAIGIEIEERYCEIAANRLAQGVLF